MTVLSIHTMVTEAADRTAEGLEEPDQLEEELIFYDPVQIKEEVEYNQERLKNLLMALKVDTWVLDTKQRKQAEAIIRKHQRAFNILGEPLGCTNLVKHKIDLMCDQPVR